jgi:hypothetical protein
MTTQSLAHFREQLKTMPVQELDAKIELYSGLRSKGLRDEVLLSCYQAEMERRFAAWEACQV